MPGILLSVIKRLAIRAHARILHSNICIEYSMYIMKFVYIHMCMIYPTPTAYTFEWILCCTYINYGASLYMCFRSRLSVASFERSYAHTHPVVLAHKHIRIYLNRDL